MRDNPIPSRDIVMPPWPIGFGDVASGLMMNTSVHRPSPWPAPYGKTRIHRVFHRMPKNYADRTMRDHDELRRRAGLAER